MNNPREKLVSFCKESWDPCAAGKITMAARISELPEQKIHRFSYHMLQKQICLLLHVEIYVYDYPDEL